MGSWWDTACPKMEHMGYKSFTAIVHFPLLAFTFKLIYASVLRFEAWLPIARVQRVPCTRIELDFFVLLEPYSEIFEK